jgi:hypothetical protein
MYICGNCYVFNNDYIVITSIVFVFSRISLLNAINNISPYSFWKQRAAVRAIGIEIMLGNSTCVCNRKKTYVRFPLLQGPLLLAAV